MTQEGREERAGRVEGGEASTRWVKGTQEAARRVGHCPCIMPGVGGHRGLQPEWLRCLHEELVPAWSHSVEDGRSQ